MVILFLLCPSPALLSLCHWISNTYYLLQESPSKSNPEKYTQNQDRQVWWRHSLWLIVPHLLKRCRKLIRVIELSEEFKNFKTKGNKNEYMFQLHWLRNKKAKGSTWVGLKHMFARISCFCFCFLRIRHDKSRISKPSFLLYTWNFLF